MLSFKSIQMGLLTAYHVEYTIQETTCSKSTEEVTAEKCPLMSCEFSVSKLIGVLRSISSWALFFVKRLA